MNTLDRLVAKNRAIHQAANSVEAAVSSLIGFLAEDGYEPDEAVAQARYWLTVELDTALEAVEGTRRNS